MLGQMSEGVRRKPEVKRGEQSWWDCGGREGSREGGMESIGRRKEEGNRSCGAQEGQSRCHMWCLKLFEIKGFGPYNGGKLEGIACCLG